MGLELRGSISLDGSGWESGINKVTHSLKDLALEAAGIYTITQAITKTVELGEKLIDTSRRIGVSVEALQEFTFAARQNGSSIENLITFIERLNSARIKMVRKLLRVLILSMVLGSALPAGADVTPTTLDKLISVSKYALVGKVIRRIDVERVKIAEVRVVSTLKGRLRFDKVYMAAQPSWMEDSGHAVLDETALLFLVPDSTGIDEFSPFRKKLREVIGNDQLFVIAWSGRGRSPIVRRGDLDYIPVLADRTAQVKLPEKIRTIADTDYTDGRVRLARLDDVLEFIRKRVH